MASGNNTKMNISYTIQAIDRFTKTHQRLQRQLNQLEAMSNKLSAKKEIKVDADTTNATRSLRRIERQANSIPRRIKIHVQTEYKRFRSAFNRMADTLRDFDEISLSMVKGGIFTALPAIVPIIGVAAGGIGAIGAAFLSAGAGAAGFAAVAVPTISSVIEANEKLTEAQEKVNKATNPKERAEAMKELKAIQSEYTKEQLESVKALQKFNSFFSNFRKQFEPGILSAFNKGLEALQRILEMSKPAIQGVTNAVNNLMLALNKNLGAKDVKEFFAWMGKTAGPYLEKLTKAFGNFAMGLINMLVAFDPLAQDFANGLLNMSERFREWAATLGENPQFQNFMKFVRENTPTVLSLIGNLVQTLVNFGIAMAPIGVSVLNAANAFFEWTSELFKNHEWVAKLIAIVTVAMGLFRIFWPIISLGISLFRTLWPIVQKAWQWFGKLKGPLQTLMPIIKNVGSKILFLARGPIGILISIVISLAITIVKNWDTIWAKTKEIFNKVANWISQKWDLIKEKFLIVKNIVNTAVSKFNEFRNRVEERMSSVVKAVKRGWDKAMNFLRGINLASIGRDIIQGLVNGIKSASKRVADAVKGAVNKAIDKAKSLLGIKSPSRVFRELGMFTGEGFAIGIERMSSMVNKASARMINAAVPSSVPTFSVGVADKPPKAIKREYVEVGRPETKQTVNSNAGSTASQPVIINLRLGTRDFRWLVEDITKAQRRNEKTVEMFRR